MQLSDPERALTALVYEETSHLEVIFFLPFQQSHCQKAASSPDSGVGPWNRPTSWGSVQEMFILYFKISVF